MQGLAQRYLVQALTMARFAGDEGLGGEILAAMSHQAAYVAQPGHAIDMALAAQLAGRRAGLSVLETESIVMEAHGHALRKDAGSCSRALRRAETVFSQTNGRNLPAWLSYFDEAYFAAKIAHCFHALGQGKQTEKYAVRSLDMNPRYIRGKAFNTSLLAISHALQGQLDQACTHGREAIDLTSSLDSARATRAQGVCRGDPASSAAACSTPMMVAAPRISPRLIMSCASATGTQRTASASSISGSPTRSAPRATYTSWGASADPSAGWNVSRNSTARGRHRVSSSTSRAAAAALSSPGST